MLSRFRALLTCRDFTQFCCAQANLGSHPREAHALLRHGAQLSTHQATRLAADDNVFFRKILSNYAKRSKFASRMQYMLRAKTELGTCPLPLFVYLCCVSSPFDGCVCADALAGVFSLQTLSADMEKLFLSNSGSVIIRLRRADEVALDALPVCLSVPHLCLYPMQ
jgi:hypothetical protein